MQTAPAAEVTTASHSTARSPFAADEEEVPPGTSSSNAEPPSAMQIIRQPKISPVGSRGAWAGTTTPIMVGTHMKTKV